MSPLARVALLLAVTLSTAAAPPPAPSLVNPDFENGAPGELPPGWHAPTSHLGYATVLTTDAPKQGKQCVRVSGAPKPTESGMPAFGNVMQQIDATAYRGRRVRLRGAVRVEGARAGAGLWLRVDLPNRQMGFLDNMQDRPIRSAQWAYYDIAADVAGDAETLNLGMMLTGEGSAWLDDVTLTVVPNVSMRAAPPRAVTARGLENLAAFARLFGIVRHFHASDEAANANWDAVAVNAIDVVENASDPSELVARLTEVLRPLAPSMHIYRTDAKPMIKIGKPAAATAIVAWEHHGFGFAQPHYNKMYRSERIRRDVDAPANGLPDPLQPLRIDLGGGVSAFISLAVYADATHTLPEPSRPPMVLSESLFTGNDRATRIGAVVILWNILQHFYPYFDVTDVDWPAELRNALRTAATDRDEADFLITLRKLMAAIHDGHGSVSHPSLLQRATLPVAWRVIGESLVILNADAEGISAGDEVLAIDGKPAMQAVRERESLISGATPQWRRAMAVYELTTGRADKKAALTIANADGTTRQVTLAYAPRNEPLRMKRPEKIAELKPGLWYVDLDRISDADFDAALDELAMARGIDLRGYPRTGAKPLQHLIDGPTRSARWNVPILRRPDREGVDWDTGGRWDLQPAQPRLTKNVAVLTNGSAISYAESWMGIVEAYKLGEIVGEPTAGTNGNVTMIKLPGGCNVVFTGMKVLKHDGSRHHGIGIAPTVPVLPTLAGIRAGRDEQLEKAIEVLENKTKAAQ
jgi:hypothetical protein